MQTRLILIALITLVFAIIPLGCEFIDQGNEMERHAAKVDAVAKELADATDKADAVTRALEDVSGQRLSEDTISRVEKIADKVESVSKTVSGIAGTVGAVPTPASPWARALGLIAGAVGTLAGAVGTFMERRRRKQTETGLDTMILAVNSMPQVGTKIATTAQENGGGDVIKERYDAMPASALKTTT